MSDLDKDLEELDNNDLKKKKGKIKIVNNVKKKNKKFTVLDLFCGCGGMSKGLQDAGFDILAGIDIWDKAIENYKKNNNHTAICADLKNLSPIDFNNLYNKNKKKIDIIVGGPPCFVAGTNVLTNNGYQPIETVRLNNKLLTHLDNFQNIINLQNKLYTGDLYELKIEHLTKIITCTKEHPFYVRSKVKKWNNTLNKYEYIYLEPKWKTADNLTLDDYHGMVINKKSITPEFIFKKEVNQNEYENVNILLNNPNYWYFIGYFLRNGYIEEIKDIKIYNINFTINNNEIEVYNKIKTILNITEHYNYTEKYNKFTCNDFIWYNILIKFGKYTQEKVIPEWVQDAPKEFIQEFINGYIKSCDNMIELDSISYNLIYGLERLYLKLNKKIDTSSYIDNNYIWYSLKSITKKFVENIPVYNFEVENDNSYIVENIIVHNCQGFSIAGRRKTNDPRNSLFMEYIKYLDFFQPKAFIMENVIGILSMKTEKNENVIDIIKQYLEKNYNIIITKLYASDFEVPQNRRRVIIIGLNKKLKKYPSEPELILLEKDRIPVKSILLKKENIEAKYFLSEKAITGINNKKQKSIEKGVGFGAQFLNLDKPSYTIPARYWKDGYDALVKYSDTEIRKLTILELKRIQTFPDDYILEGSTKDVIMQIGNAVACKFAYHLGKHLLKLLD
jgi:DNA (cytosine-5)-methyltransferase 1